MLGENRSVISTVSAGLKNIYSLRKSEETTFLHVTMMNIPPLAAKRDASYETAVGILDSKITSTSSGELMVAYTDFLKLLSISEKTHKEMVSAISKSGRKNIIDTHGVYLRLLSDMVSSALFVLSSSSIICADEQTVANIIGNRKNKTKDMLAVFSKCEFELRQSIADLYGKAAKTVEQEKERMKRTFNPDDLERYNSAYREFLKKFD